MSFWVREIVGWLLLLVGLFGYVICLADFLERDRVISAGILAGMATMVLRTGLHLIRVATAARIVVRAGKK